MRLWSIITIIRRLKPSNRWIIRSWIIILYKLKNLSLLSILRIRINQEIEKKIIEAGLGVIVEAEVEAGAELREDIEIEIKVIGNPKKSMNLISMKLIFTTNNRFIRCSIKNLFHIKIIKILEYRSNNKCDYIIYKIIYIKIKHYIFIKIII